MEGGGVCGAEGLPEVSGCPPWGGCPPAPRVSFADWARLECGAAPSISASRPARNSGFIASPHGPEYVGGLEFSMNGDIQTNMVKLMGSTRQKRRSECGNAASAAQSREHGKA